MLSNAYIDEFVLEERNLMVLDFVVSWLNSDGPLYPDEITSLLRQEECLISEPELLEVVLMGVEEFDLRIRMMVDGAFCIPQI